MNRSGFALVVSILIAITLSLVGLGALAVGIRESAIAHSVELRERARLRAEAGAIGAVVHWSSRAYADLAIGQSRAVQASDMEIDVARIDSALFLVRADWEDVSYPGLGAVGRAAYLIRTYPHHRVVDYFPAAVSVEESGWMAAGAVVDPDTCGPAVAGPVTLLEGSSISGDVVSLDPSKSEDPFPSEFLGAIATIQLESAGVRPRPLALGGECRIDPANWGATAPMHPCHDLLPLIHAAGPLSVDGGVGRGVLVVDGDLVLDGSFHFQGIVLVRGTLTLRGGASVEGVVRATSLNFEDGRVIRGACDLRPVLAGPGLDRAYRPPGRWRVPVF